VERVPRRNRTAAAVSSLFIPGSGQIYLGQVLLGCTWLAATVALYTAAFLLFRISAPMGLVTLLLPFGCHIICFIDALDPQTLGPSRDEAPVRTVPRGKPASAWAVRLLAIGLGGVLVLALVAAVRGPLIGRPGYDRPLSIPIYRVAAHEGDRYLVILQDNPGFGDALWQIAARLRGSRPAVDVHFWIRDYAHLVPTALPVPREATCVELGEIVLNPSAGVRRFLVPSRDGCH
jgi:hypothetical protein